METRKIIIGIGTSGSNIVNLFSSRNFDKNTIKTMAIDSVDEVLDCHNIDKAYSMSTCLSMGDVVEALGRENIEYYFPCDAGKYNISFLNNLRMNEGTGGFRLKGLLSFEFFLNNYRDEFVSTLKSYLCDDGMAQYKIYLVSSTCGGTGSALLLPLSLYIKKLFKEEFKKEIECVALLTCPEIYTTNVESHNFVEKMYANSYACVKEINAVQNACLGYNLQENDRINLIDIKIGDAKDPYLGLLFDSKAVDSVSKDLVPFQKIYMFDRVAGENTISIHEKAISDILFSLVENYFVDEDINHLCGSVSFSEVCYPVESISNYAKNKITSDFVNNDILYSTNSFSYFIFIAEKNAKSCGRRLGQTTSSSKFFLEYLDKARTNFENDFSSRDYDTFSGYILGRKVSDVKYDLADDEKFASFEQSFLEALRYKAISKEEAKNISAKFDLKNAKKIKPIKKREKEVSKDKKVEDLTRRFEKYYKIINDYYKEKVSIFVHEKNKYHDELFSNDESPLSIVSHFLVEDGRNVHPVVAYIRLCKLLSLFERRLRSFSLTDTEFAYITDGREHDIYFKFLKLQEEKLYKTSDGSYAKNDCKRLCSYAVYHLPVYTMNSIMSLTTDYVCSNEVLAEKPKYDDIAFMKDCISTVGELCNNFVFFYLKSAKDEVERLVNRYSEFFKCLSKAAKVFSYEADSSCKDGTYCGKFVTNVGASIEQKEETLKKYIKEKMELGCYHAFLDDLFGGCIFDFANSDDEITKESCVDLISGIREKCGEDFNESQTFSEVKDLTIAEALQHSVEENPDISFKIHSFEPIRIVGTDNDNDLLNLVSSTMFIPKSSEEYILDKTASPNNCNSNQLVNEFIEDICASEFDVKVKNELDERAIFHGKSLTNLNLDNFAIFNENNDQSIFKHYLSSLENKKYYHSELWNPHIFKSDADFYLPLIHEKLEKKYEYRCVKALMYCLSHRLVSLMRVDETDNLYISLDSEGIRKPILLDDSYVLAEDYEGLFNYIKCHKNLCDDWSNEFDSEIKKGKTTIPPFTNGGSSGRQSVYILRALDKIDLTQNETYKLEKKTIHSFIYFAYYLSNVKGNITSKLGNYIAKVYFDVLLNLCESCSEETETRLLQSESIGSVYEKLERYNECKTIIKWIETNKLTGFVAKNK